MRATWPRADSIDRNNHRIRDNKRIDGSGSHCRRSVDDDDIEIRQDRLQLPAEQKLPVDFFRLQQVIGFNIDGVGEEVELRAKSGLNLA